MVEEEGRKERNDRPIPSSKSPPSVHRGTHNNAGDEVSGILSERIDNLREAIEELDDALANRKVLSKKRRLVEPSAYLT